VNRPIIHLVGIWIGLALADYPMRYLRNVLGQRNFNPYIPSRSSFQRAFCDRYKTVAEVRLTRSFLW